MAKPSIYSYRPSDARSVSLLVEALRIRLGTLSYLAFALCTKRLLEVLGYENVQLSDRKWLRGRTKSAGRDMEALAPHALGRLRTIVQLKPSGRQPVSRRFVQELRGTALSNDAPYGVIITTSTFSQAARDEAKKYSGRPIRLIDGVELAAIMIGAHIGVVEQRNITTGDIELSFDEAPFELLEHHCALLRSKKPKDREAMWT